MIALVCHIGVKEPQAGFYAELAEQQTSNPFEIHVVEVDSLLLEVGEQIWVDSFHHIFHSAERFLNSWP